MSDTYKPTEHDGLKQDGTPDQRVGTGRQSCIQDSLTCVSTDTLSRVRSGQGGPSVRRQRRRSNLRLRERGQWRYVLLSLLGIALGEAHDKAEFAHGKVDPKEAGKAGGTK
jgi:hypothetical protein